MRKKRGCGCFSAIIVIIVIIILAAIALTQMDEIKDLIYPRHYENIIEEYADEYGIDKWLVMALIRSESGFDAAATSHAGARGLMQLMPDTAEWLINRGGFDMEAEDALGDADKNIQLGIYYLSVLIAYYQDEAGNIDLATVIAAYNAGIGTVDQWLREDVWDGKTATIEDIPYGETQSHIRKVLHSYERYQAIYD